jgi:hypothetical protein
MPDDLHSSNDKLDEAIIALQRARQAYDLNERLRCLHIGLLRAQDAHNLIVNWRTGQAPKAASDVKGGPDVMRPGCQEPGNLDV